MIGKDLKTIEALKLDLDERFKIKDLGKLKYFLGIEVARSKEGIHIFQKMYAINRLTEAGILESKPSNVPLY